MNTLVPNDFEAADPLNLHLDTVLLPEMEFDRVELDVIVECLRHVAGRAIATSSYPTPGGVSITLLVSPTQRAEPTSLKVALGDTLSDALWKLAEPQGLMVVFGVVGVLICSADVGEYIVATKELKEPLTELPEGAYSILGRMEWLRLVAHYPVLAISSSPVRKAWARAVLESDQTPETVLSLAAHIVHEMGQEDGDCLTQMPPWLPDLSAPSIPGIPGLD